MSLAVIGATSAIAQSITKEFSQAGHDVLLVSRSTDSLQEFVMDICTKVKVDVFEADILDLDMVALMADRVLKSFDDDPYILVAVGAINREHGAKTNSADAIEVIDVNFRNIVALITALASDLERKGKGCLILISSVAGDRGRQSNYVYGSAKAGLSTFAQGLRNRLYAHGVHVLTVKPGYIDTPMLRQALGDKYEITSKLIIGRTDRIGRRVYSAALAGRNVIYTPSIWRMIMFIIRNIPEAIFKKMHF